MVKDGAISTVPVAAHSGFPWVMSALTVKQMSRTNTLTFNGFTSPHRAIEIVVAAISEYPARKQMTDDELRGRRPRAIRVFDRDKKPV